MAAKRRRSAPIPPDDLAQVVREAAGGAVGLSTEAIKKRLPLPYQRFPRAVVAALGTLERGGALVALRRNKSKSPLYFDRGGVDQLDALTRERLSTPLTKGELRSWLFETAPGYRVVFDAWLKRALTREVLFVHGLARTKQPRFGREPEPEHQVLLRPVLKALRSVVAKADQKGIARRHLAAALLAELGLAGLTKSGATGDGSREFLAALDGLAAEDPANALLPVRLLRRRLSLEKREFDDLALRLAREGIVSLHYHDYPGSLPESERSELVVDARGTHYVGIAPRNRR